MRPTALSTVLALTLPLAATPAQASTIDVRVLSSKFTATVEIGHESGGSQKKTSMGPDPVSESVSQAYCDVDLSGVFPCDSGASDPIFVGATQADASASLLEVLAYADGGGGSWIGVLQGGAGAVADSEWTFRPLVDGVAVIDIFLSGLYISGIQSASLFDVTANQLLWQFSTISATPYTEVVPTPLSAQHVYAMHLHASALGQGDTTLSTLRVSGIQAAAVPDNVDSFACLCMGLFVALLGKWKLGT